MLQTLENSAIRKYHFSDREQLPCYPDLHLTCSVFVSNHSAENLSHRLSSASVHTRWYQPAYALAAISHFLCQQRIEERFGVIFVEVFTGVQCPPTVQIREGKM